MCKQLLIAINGKLENNTCYSYFFQKPPEATTGDLPALSDLVPIINDQSQYINHLEAEVKFCKVLDNIFHLLKP